MDRIDRMTIDLLTHYAFTLHEDVSKLTDQEIDIARNYAENYLETNHTWKNYVSDFEIFVNRQRFKVITNSDYDELEKLMYQVIKEINDIINKDEWEFNIYYSVDYDNKLLLSRLCKEENNETIDISYDIELREIKPFNVPISDDMDKLGTINYNSYSFYELYNVKI